MSDTDAMKSLATLAEMVDCLETQLEQGMTQEQMENAIKEVSQTITTLQGLQQEIAVDSAINSAQIVESSDESPFE